MATQDYRTERWLEKKLQLQGAFLEWEGKRYNLRMIEHSEVVLHPLKSGQYRALLYSFLLQWALISGVIILCAVQWFSTPVALGILALLLVMCWKKCPPFRPVLFIRLFRSTIAVPIHKNEIPQARLFLEKVLSAGGS